MKKFRILLILFSLIIGWVTILQSCKEKNAEYPPRIWSEYSYKTTTIASRTISTILYENNHSIWLGALGGEGLLHQDGYKWNVYNTATTGIEFDSITALTRDGKGNLWVGWRSGLANFDGNLWQNADEFTGLTVTSFAIEGIGNIIAAIKGESGGIAVLHDKEWIFYSKANSDIPSGKINAIASDHNQVLWLASADKGILTFKNNVWEIVSNEIPLLSQNFTCIATAPDGSIWAGTEASQLVHFYNDTYLVLNTGTSKPITSIVTGDDGSIWCGTTGGGLVKFDGANWTSYTMENTALPSNHILCLAKGDSGNLFFSIPGGKVLMINQ